MSDTVLHATDADFDHQVLSSDQPVLVDFWAPWCGPCKMIAPALDDLAGTYAGRAKIVKVDVDQNQATALKYHVRSIPMLLLFKGGQVQATQIGAVGKAQLAQLIEKALYRAALRTCFLPLPLAGEGRGEGGDPLNQRTPRNLRAMPRQC